MSDELAQIREAVEAIQRAERVKILRCPECGWQVLREHGVDGQRCEAIEIDAELDCDGVCEVVSLVPAYLLDMAVEALRDARNKALAPRKPVGDGEVVLRLTRAEAQELANLADLPIEETPWGVATRIRTPLGDKLRAALDQGAAMSEDREAPAPRT